MGDLLEKGVDFLANPLGESVPVSLSPVLFPGVPPVLPNMGAGAAASGGGGTDVGELAHQFGAETLGGIESEQVSLSDVLAAASGIAEQNIERFPRAAGAAADVAVEQGARFDEFMSRRFFENLERVLPGFQEDIIESQRGMLDRVTGITESFLSGELPEDVRAEIERARAERGIQTGLFGPAREAATARDIGRTSLDLVQQGINVAGGVVSPLTSRLLSSALTLTPPVSDIPSLFTAGLSAAVPGATISPSAAVQAGTSIGVANAQSAVAAQVSNANIALDLLQTQVQADLNQQMIDVAKTGQQLQLFTDLIGAGAQVGSLFI